MELVELPTDLNVARHHMAIVLKWLPKGPSTNTTRTLYVYAGDYEYGLGQLFLIEVLGPSGAKTEVPMLWFRADSQRLKPVCSFSRRFACPTVRAEGDLPRPMHVPYMHLDPLGMKVCSSTRLANSGVALMRCMSNTAKSNVISESLKQKPCSQMCCTV